MITNNVNIRLGELSFNGELALSEDYSKLIFGNGLGLAGKARIAVETVADDPMEAGYDALMLGAWVASKLLFHARVNMPESETRRSVGSAIDRHTAYCWYLPVADIRSVRQNKTEILLDTPEGPVYLYFPTPKKAGAWCNVLWKLYTGKKLNLLERSLLT